MVLQMVSGNGESGNVRVRPNDRRGGAHSNMKEFLEPALQIPCIAPERKCTSGYHVTFVSS